MSSDDEMESQNSAAKSAEDLNKINSGDCFKILLATDIHLGYAEEDPIRGNDSFISFEEILFHAKEQKVDFILLGGDLFHHPAPSKDAYTRCINLLKKYVLGDDPIEFEMLSNHDVNFESPNINIAIPVFSIHGNHDDQSGVANKSSLEVLSESSLINYFGKWNDLTEINVSPILLKKGITQIALYGLSHIHDNRLSRLFNETKVTMEKPNDGSGSWFNMLVLHQNRVDRGPKNYIPEEILPEFLDFVLWGHEHDCRIKPVESVGEKFLVCQPGSSVATSLCEGESLEKHIGIMYVYQDQFRLDPIKLKTVRPFIFKSIDLGDYDELDEGDVVPKVKDLVADIVEKMINEAKQKENDCPQQPKLPLIRLRVIYRDECQVFNAIRFGQQYSDRVANPKDMLHMQRHIKRVKVEKKPIDEEAMKNAFSKDDDDDNDDTRLEDYVGRYFNDPNNEEKLQVIVPGCLSEMCRLLAEFNDENSAKRVAELSKKKACQFLAAKMPAEEEIDVALEEFRSGGDSIFKDIQKELGNPTVQQTIPFVSNDKNDEKENQEASTSSARGSKSALSKSTAATTSVRGRGANRANSRSTANSTTTTKASNASANKATPQATTRRGTRQRAMEYDDSD